MTTSDPPGMLPAERRARVVELLRRRGTVRVQDLAGELDVSAITVRRDIARLAAEGLVHRVHGGATLQPGITAEPATDPAVPAGGMTLVEGSANGHERQLTIGIVVPSLDYYWPDVLRGVQEAAAGAKARIVLRGATYEAAEEHRQLARLVELVRVDGLLVAPTTTGAGGEALVRWLRSTGVPVVLLERTTPDPYRGALESVVSDHALGAALAVHHLAELGHRRVGLMTTIGSPTAPHVRRGWQEACAELGLELEGTPDRRTVDQHEPSWPTALDALLDACLGSGTTALLVHSDPEAISLVQRCQERGVRVPDDLSVVTYDDEVAELCDPPLTAVRPPKAAIGRAAVALLAGRLGDPGRDRPVHRIVIEPQLIARASSGPAPASPRNPSHDPSPLPPSP